MTSGPCQNQGPNGVGAPGGDLCGTVTVMVTCRTGGTTFSFGPMTLTAFAESGTHTVVGGLAAGVAARCTFTVTYAADAPSVLSTRALQPVTWTLTAEEIPSTTTPSPPSPGDEAAAPGPGPLAFTGGDALPLVLTGLALLLLGGLLFSISRRHASGTAV